MLGGNPIAAITGSAARTSPTMAAFVNGCMLHVLDFEVQGLPPNHGTSNLLPPLLALAEMTNADGGRLLASFIVGWDVQHRLRASAEQNPLTFHPPGIFGPLGAAAAAGHLLELSADQVAMAFGFAASRTGGLFANNGTMAKCMHPGNAGRMGVESALLAAGGMTSNPDILDASQGFFDTLFARRVDTDRITKGLGAEFMLASAGFNVKKYPAEIYMQRIIEVGSQARNRHSFKVFDVESVDVEMANVLDELSRPAPVSGLDGKFSYQFCAALGLTQTVVGVSSFHDEVLQQPEVQHVLARVKLHQNSAIPKSVFDTWVVIRVVFRDGSVIEEKCEQMPGFCRTPLTKEQQEAKFTDCTSHMLGVDAQVEVLAALANIEYPGSLPVLFGAMACDQKSNERINENVFGLRSHLRRPSRRRGQRWHVSGTCGPRTKRSRRTPRESSTRVSWRKQRIYRSYAFRI
jgi:2-methylcitrate dehydratase PrpD